MITCTKMSPLLLFLMSCLAVVCDAKKNVLFLVADDLRPNLDVYKNLGFHLGPSHTPYLDKLAEKSMLFQRAYVQYPVCGPSRTSFLTGRRPDTTHVYDLVRYFRNIGSNFTTMPQYFKQNGYQTEGTGKIFHPGRASGFDDPISWNNYHQITEDPYYNGSRVGSWKAVNDTERSSYPLWDERIANEAKKMLNTLSKGTKPFFLAIGFHKPHLPFVFPEKFLSNFRSVSLPSNPYAPIDMPDLAWNAYRELRSYPDIKKLNASGGINTTLPDDIVLNLRRGYFSAVSYMDSLVGEVLTELKRLNLENNTIISFIGDHGYDLGEHGLWGKGTNFEDSSHAPMMISVPGLTDGGLVTKKLVEHVDLFPTLVEAAGLPRLKTCPKNIYTDVCTEGYSMLPLLMNPNMEWNRVAFSQTFHPRRNIMGYSMRTDRYRYTEWVKFNTNTFKPDFSISHGVELYDHQNDEQENVNVANRPENAQIVSTLRTMLRRGWRSPTQNPHIIG